MFKTHHVLQLLKVLAQPSAGIGVVDAQNTPCVFEGLCGDRACRIALAVVPCTSVFRPRDPLRRCSASMR